MKIIIVKGNCSTSQELVRKIKERVSIEGAKTMVVYKNADDKERVSGLCSELGAYHHKGKPSFELMKTFSTIIAIEGVLFPEMEQKAISIE